MAPASRRRGYYSESVDHEVAAAIRAAGPHRQGPGSGVLVQRKRQQRPPTQQLSRSRSATTAPRTATAPMPSTPSESMLARRGLVKPAAAPVPDPRLLGGHDVALGPVPPPVALQRRRRFFAAQDLAALLAERGVVLSAQAEAATCCCWTLLTTRTRRFERRAVDGAAPSSPTAACARTAYAPTPRAAGAAGAPRR